MQITDPRIEDYIRGLLARHDEPVLLEMEAEEERRRLLEEGIRLEPPAAHR